MALDNNNLGQRTAGGAVWLISQTALTRLFSFATFVILSRILFHEDYAAYGAALAVTSFFTQLCQPGVDDVLLQKRHVIGDWITAAFWLNLAFGLLGALAMCGVGWIVVDIAKHFPESKFGTNFGNSTVFWIIVILSIAAPLNSAGQIPITYLRAQLRFAKLSALNVIEVISVQVLYLTFACLKFKAYSLVLPMPIVAAGRLILLFWIARPPIRLQLDTRRWPTLLSSTGWLFVQRIIGVSTTVGDNISLGIFGTVAALGEYQFSYQLTTQAIGILCAVLAQAVQPALTAFQFDYYRLLDAADRACRTMGTIIAPLSIMLIVCAKPGVHLAFSSEWQDTARLIQLLAMGNLIYGACWPLQGVLLARGRFRALSLTWVANSVLFLLMVFPATKLYSAIGTAAAVGCWYMLAALIFAWIAYQSFAGVGRFLGAALPSALAAIIAGLPAWWIVSRFADTKLSNLEAIICGTLIVAIVYLPALLLLDRATVLSIFSHGRQFIQPFARRYFPRLAEAEVEGITTLEIEPPIEPPK